MRFDYFHRHLSVAFQGLGRCVSAHPLWFFFVPLIATGILSTGFIRIKLQTKLEYLYTPVNGRSKLNRESIVKLFPPTGMQDFHRLTTFPPFAMIIATPVDGGTVLREAILDEIALLDTVIRNITIKSINGSYSYQDVCMKSEGKDQCFPNDSLTVRGKISDLRKGKLKIKYPVERDWMLTSFKVYAYNLGGVTVDEEGYAQDAKAFRLLYVLDELTGENNEKANQWMAAFLDEVPKIVVDKVKVSRMTRSSLDIETNKITISVYPTLILAAIVMVAFGAVSCMTSDWITSKPWLGIAACVSSLIGTSGAFGLLLLLGAEYVDINIAIAFLMLGVGMDDSFVILAAWRLTDPKDPVEKRMSKAYSESAVSVSITSLTNCLASCVGIATPYRVIRIYSLYSATAILFTYITQITFFGGCVALSGRREFKNRHAAFCFPVKRDSTKGFLLTMLTEGCVEVKTSYVNSDSAATRTISYEVFNSIGNALCKPCVKVAVLLLFLIYFAMGIYAAKNHIVVAFDYVKAFPRYSYARQFVNDQYEFFSEYALSFQLVINSTLDYSDPGVQKDIEEILGTFESSPYVRDSAYTESWLREYLNFKSTGMGAWFFEKRNTNNSEEFIGGLKDVFLKVARRFKDDVRFSEDGSKIIASRFILPCRNVTNAVEERKFLTDLWERADSSKHPVYLNSPYFFIYDISSGVERTSVQCLIVSAVLVIFVFILFIPSFICAFSVSVMVLMIEISLIGYASLWNVNFNIISMICVMVSVGLSVDYSAHISYAFISCKKSSPDEKLKVALLSAGYPAFQGSVSTILGVITLCAAPMDSLVIFFKIVCLVMSFAFLHAVFLTPVTLSLLEELKILLMKGSLWKRQKTLKNMELENEMTGVAEEML